jgi:streptomycin 6-kinase
MRSHVLGLQAISTGVVNIQHGPAEYSAIPALEIRGHLARVEGRGASGYYTCMLSGVSEQLARNCRKTPERADWLARLPATVQHLADRWSLTLGTPFDDENASTGWVTRVTLSTGASAVLKLGMPHMESQHEICGLRFWDGDPTVRLLEADEDFGAMLLERCDPGTPLRNVSEPEQDSVIAGLLKRLWRLAAAPFRPLSVLMAHWSEETLAHADSWTDSGLVREGLRLFDELSRNSPTMVLLATDLHAGNVLRAHREPWLVIDPKPFVGDPAFDATQHLLNCTSRLRSNPDATIRSFADLLGIDDARIRLWTFARAAADPRENWKDDHATELATILARSL